MPTDILGNTRSTFTSKEYEAMGSDAVRNKVYRNALKRASLAGFKRVFDVGAGPRALLCSFAAEYGFHVSGIEPDVTAFKSAQKTLKTLKKLRCLQAQDPKTSKWLSELKPDVVVCELLGFLASSEGMFSALSAVQKSLPPDALILPTQAATLFTLSCVSGTKTRGYTSPQFALVKRLHFHAVEMSTMLPLEEFDCGTDLAPQLSQKRVGELVATRTGRADSLSFWIKVDFNLNSKRLARGSYFTSKYGDSVSSASNWHNMVLWLPSPILVRKGQIVTVESVSDATAYPCVYSFTITAGKSTQAITLDNLIPHMSPRTVL